MLGPLVILFAALAHVASGAAVAPFCSAVNSLVTKYKEQAAATSYCSSFLAASPVLTTSTTTSIRLVNTASPSTTTQVSLVTATTVQPTTISSVQTSTEQLTLTVTSSTTASISYVTVYTATVSSGSLSTVIASSDYSTTTTTISAPLSACTAPANLKKRTLQARRAPAPKPKAWSGYSASSIISQACGCLSISRPASTVLATAVTTKSAGPATVVTVSSTSTSTATSIQTVVETRTVVVTNTNVATAISSLTITSTISTASTTTLSGTTTVTLSSIATATVQVLGPFALLASYNGRYGIAQNSVGGSGDGVYFSQADANSAEPFTMIGNRLYNNGQFLNSYQTPTSGSYFPVINRPFEAYGFPTTCTMNNANGGCEVSCTCDGAGIFPVASGNNVDNYGGAWGLQGNVDDFTIYAVGQT